MTAIWITLGVLGYLTVAAATMRVSARRAERNGTREQELRRTGLISEVAPGLAWPVVVPFLLVGALLVGFHALATWGIGKGRSR